MGSPQIFNLWGEWRKQSPNDACVILSDLLAEREGNSNNPFFKGRLRVGENFLRSLRVINQLSTAKTKASPATPEAK